MLDMKMTEILTICSKKTKKLQISQPKLGQIGYVGGVLKMSGPVDFKSVPGLDN